MFKFNKRMTESTFNQMKVSELRKIVKDHELTPAGKGKANLVAAVWQECSERMEASRILEKEAKVQDLYQDWVASKRLASVVKGLISGIEKKSGQIRSDLNDEFESMKNMNDVFMKMEFSYESLKLRSIKLNRLETMLRYLENTLAEQDTTAAEIVHCMKEWYEASMRTVMTSSPVGNFGIRGAEELVKYRGYQFEANMLEKVCSSLKEGLETEMTEDESVNDKRAETIRYISERRMLTLV